ncbi:zinc-binding protein A33-like [Heptranchias perlo]|uniref:zinc-binding protein A33-like n=1 Tax=Heptranchias perlo TaxID=212740 RepID=UPI00355ABCFD
MDTELSCAACHKLCKGPVSPASAHRFGRSCTTRRGKRGEKQSLPGTLKPPSCALPGGPARSLDGRASGAEGSSQQQCQEHQEALKLYCLTDKQLLCVVCQSSKRHKNHQMVPVGEAAEEFKELLQTLLKPLQSKNKECNTSKSNCERTLACIEEQTNKAEKQIKEKFEKLHQFLRKEEKSALQKLKQEKKKKIQTMKGKIKKITEEISSLSATIQEIQQELSEQDNIIFLMKFPETEKKYRAKGTIPAPARAPAPAKAYPVVNVGKCIGSLQYTVWKKMLTVINTAPVTLDPCTAHPYLLLSEELTSVSHTMKRQRQLFNCPERFDPCLCVLGCEGFTSGKHYWEVTVGKKTEWDVGLARESINRKGVSDLNPDNGFWLVALRVGNQYRAATKTWKHLDLREKPRKIRVCLDYEGGKVSFYNSDNMSHIFTFTDRFHEKLYPYFSPGHNDGGKNAEPLKICSLKVTIQEEQDFIKRKTPPMLEI